MKLSVIARRALLTLASVAFAAGGARAQNILYYSDYTQGTDHMAEALSALPGSYSVTYAGSPGSFSSDLATGSYNLAIFFEQGYTGYDAQFAQIAAFVAAGGSAIVDDWYLYNSSQITPLGATFTGGSNETSFTVTGPLAAGITNPVGLTNPGWGIFSDGLSPNAGSTAAALFPSGDGAITIDSTGRSIINGFLSDTISDGQAVQLYTNEIVTALGQGAVPEPSSVALLGLGAVAGVVARRRIARRRAVA